MATCHDFIGLKRKSRDSFFFSDDSATGCASVRKGAPDFGAAQHLRHLSIPLVDMARPRPQIR